MIDLGSFLYDFDCISVIFIHFLNLSLGRLKLPTLKRYKQSHESYFSQFNAETLKNRNELIETINTHFRNGFLEKNIVEN